MIIVEIKKGNNPPTPVPGPNSLYYNGAAMKEILGVKPLDAAASLKDIIADLTSKGWISV